MTSATLACETDVFAIVVFFFHRWRETTTGNSSVTQASAMPVQCSSQLSYEATHFKVGHICWARQCVAVKGMNE